MFTVVITIIVNLTSVGLGIVFVTNLCLLIQSFKKLFRFLTEQALVSRLFQILVALLCLLLFNDFLAIPVLTWGAPAFDMTTETYFLDTNEAGIYIDSINSNDLCIDD